MRKYYVIEGHDKVYTEREFANLSYEFKGKRHKCLGTFKSRKEAERAWLEEIMWGVQAVQAARKSLCRNGVTYENAEMVVDIKERS